MLASSIAFGAAHQSSSASTRIWGLDWRRHTPFRAGELAVEMGSFGGDAVPFIGAHWAELFSGGADRFLAEPLSPAKARFGDEMDVFVFRGADRVVGVMLGHPLDWSSYYFRSIAVLPAHRDQHVLARTMEQCYAPLREAGVDRVEGECSPTNAPMMRTLTALGWIVTSTANSERWGATVRFTKYLRAEAEDVFARQFCGVRSGAAAKERRTT